MVTQISGNSPNLSVVAQSRVADGQRVVGMARSEDAGVSQSDSASKNQAPASTQMLGTYAQLRARQDDLNKAASVVREVGATTEQATQLLDKIASNMGEIVKMYPPYPIDSPQRVSLLNDISGLRKQIEALTFPPPEEVKAVGRLLDGAMGTTGKESDASETKDVLAAVNDRMWNIPALDPGAASDAEVGKALDQVKATKAALETLRDGMWNDVVSFVRDAQSPETRNAAAGVRDQLAELGGRGIGGNARQLEQAVELK